MENASLGDVCAMLAVCGYGRLRLNMRSIVELRIEQIVPAQPDRRETSGRTAQFSVAIVDGHSNGDDTADAFADFETQYALKGTHEICMHKNNIVAVEVFAWIVAALGSKAPGNVLVATFESVAVVARRAEGCVDTSVFASRGKVVFEYAVRTPEHAAWLKQKLDARGAGNSWIIGDEFCNEGRADSALVGAEPAH